MYLKNLKEAGKGAEDIDYYYDLMQKVEPAPKNDPRAIWNKSDVLRHLSAIPYKLIEKQVYKRKEFIKHKNANKLASQFLDTF